jgi:Transposase family tnp2
VQPDPLIGNHDDLQTSSGPGVLDSIVIPSAKSGACAEAIQSSLDKIHGSPCDPGHAMCNFSEIPPSDLKDLWLEDTIHLDDLKLSANFVTALGGATLSDHSSGLSSEALERLRNPLCRDARLSLNKESRLAIDMYVANLSEAINEANCAAMLGYLPAGTDLLSYYRAKQLIADLTRIESVVHNMCINSCIAYTGPFEDKESCPICSEPQYDQLWCASSNGRDKIPRQEFHTILIGPQIQVLYQEPESVLHAHYLQEERLHVLSYLESNHPLEEYSDILHSSDLIEAFQDGRIGEDNIVLMFSINGAQLYVKKASTCWIYIWVLMNLAPDRCYKKEHVFIRGFIPRPNNPKNIDSFLFPGLQHLVALQKEQLKIWDAALQHEVQSKVFLAMLAADGPGMMHIMGLVGYHGKHGCRLYCGLSGWCEPQGKHYFPALLRPNDYDVVGCMHPDIDIRRLPEPLHTRYHLNLHNLVRSCIVAQYCAQHLDTGISRPSIFSALDRASTLGLPESAGSDIMHLGVLNLSDLMISLWHGTIDCTNPDDKAIWDWVVLRGNVWQQHGKAITNCLHYLPSLFNCPPCNITEKLTSGYKAWEFLLYLYGLGPGLLLGILPNIYYTNYCKLVFGMCLMNQHKISSSNVRNALLALCSFVQEFEIIYCQCLPTRIHFVQLCMHSLIHLLQEVICLGLPICSSQWTLEHTISNLGEEIKQHSNPFANLSQHRIRRAHVNTLKALIPDLVVEGPTVESIPRTAKDLGDSFVLLCAREAYAHPLQDCKADALHKFWPATEYGSQIYV